jgi:hypothetical protein
MSGETPEDRSREFLKENEEWDRRVRESLKRLASRDERAAQERRVVEAMRERDRKMAAPDRKEQHPMSSKRRTMGVDPKVPAQAVVTILVWLLAHYGIDLDADVAAAISVVIGVLLGVLAPAPRTVTVPAKEKRA